MFVRTFNEHKQRPTSHLVARVCVEAAALVVAIRKPGFFLPHLCANVRMQTKCAVMRCEMSGVRILSPLYDDATSSARCSFRLLRMVELFYSLFAVVVCILLKSRTERLA